MDKIKKVFLALDYIEEYLIGISLIIMTTITFSNVISRRFLGLSLAFTEEITTNLFILMSLLGAAAAAKRGSHLGLSIISDVMPKKVQKAITIFGVTCSVALFSYLAYYGTIMVQTQKLYKQITPALGWPEWMFGLFIPIGSVFLIIRFIQFGISELQKGDD